MPTDNHDRLLIDVLNAAGHAGAAELAQRVLESREPASGKATSAPAPAQPAAAPSLMSAPTTEAERTAEGLHVITEMRRQLGWSPAVGADDDAAA